MTKKAVSNAKKIAMKFFRSEMTPPPFGNFLKIRPFLQRQASLRDVIVKIDSNEYDIWMNQGQRFP